MLYFEHAELYDKMYEVIFDYDEQFSIVDDYMQERGMENVLEVACGTGRLTKRLYKNDYDVMGLDLSKQMLNIATKRVPEVTFIQGDIRDFDIEKRFDAVVCFGHSFAHMVNDEDVNKSLRCFNDHLVQGGLLMMDNFDGLNTIKGFEKYSRTTDKVELEDKLIERDNQVKWNIATGLSWNWKCKYTVKQEKEIIDQFEDEQVLRSFLKSELNYFLEKNGFELVEFDENRFMHIAEKKSKK
ncbi:MAG: class I SAM-dependent methyltransferase [Thermoplasmatota archaeon]